MGLGKGEEELVRWACSDDESGGSGQRRAIIALDALLAWHASYRGIVTVTSNVVRQMSGVWV